AVALREGADVAGEIVDAEAKARGGDLRQFRKAAGFAVQEAVDLHDIGRRAGALENVAIRQERLLQRLEVRHRGMIEAGVPGLDLLREDRPEQRRPRREARV